MDDDPSDEVFAAAVIAFIDCLPRPIVYSPPMLSSRLQHIVAPRAGLFVVALDRPEQMAFAGVERTASRTGTDAVALSRHQDNPERLRFDLFLRRNAQSATFTNYSFLEAIGGGLFMPFSSGLLVNLAAEGLTPRDEVYFKTASGRLAAIDRAASRGMITYSQSI